MRILPLLIAGAAVLYSCDKKQSSVTEMQEVAVPVSDSTTMADSVSANISGENVELVSQVTGATPTEVPATAVAAKSSGVRPALNPEHGQPYHRCEIEVGAPIDSAPTQNTAPQMVPQQSVPNAGCNTNPISPSLAPSSPSAVQATGPKPANNPVHGAPHHRCDLEVGAPLI